MNGVNLINCNLLSTVLQPLKIQTRADAGFVVYAGKDVSHGAAAYCQPGGNLLVGKAAFQLNFKQRYIRLNAPFPSSFMRLSTSNSHGNQFSNFSSFYYHQNFTILMESTILPLIFA
jgi:hypothetical protein